MRVRLYFRPMAIIDDAAFFTIPIVQCSRRLAFNPSAAATKPPPPTRSVVGTQGDFERHFLRDRRRRDEGGRGEEEREGDFVFVPPPTPTDRATDRSPPRKNVRVA